MVKRNAKTKQKTNFVSKRTNHFCSFLKGYRKTKTWKLPPETEDDIHPDQL